jgi:N12 class adenine-specific DNA methylase
MSYLPATVKAIVNLARFANVPELLTMFGAVADLRTRDHWESFS